MRTSSRRDDPGFKNFVRGTRVFVNGREVPRCHTADDVLGIAWGWTPHPETGNPFIIPGTDRIHQSVYRGSVEIRRPT